MLKKLYVGNISWGLTEEALKDLFSQAGTVESAKLIIDRQTNRSKGFGFVEMGTVEEAQKAIDIFNGKEVEGRNISVSEARPLEDRPFKKPMGGGGFNRGGDRRGGFGGGNRGFRDNR